MMLSHITKKQVTNRFPSVSYCVLRLCKTRAINIQVLQSSTGSMVLFGNLKIRAQKRGVFSNDLLAKGQLLGSHVLAQETPFTRYEINPQSFRITPQKSIPVFC